MPELVPLPDLIPAEGDSTPRLLPYIIHDASWRNVQDWRPGRIPWRRPPGHVYDTVPSARSVRPVNLT